MLALFGLSQEMLTKKLALIQETLNKNLFNPSQGCWFTSRNVARQNNPAS
jgi:hypothetical protein